MKNGKEVMKLFKLQWNEKDAQKYWKEEGMTTATVKIVRNLLSSGKMSYEEIAKNTETPLDEVLRIAKESHLAY